MNQTGLRPIISWLILVYDRTAAERFPFKPKWYRFSYDRATHAEAQEVLRLVQPQGDVDLPAPPGRLGETRLSMQLGGEQFRAGGILQYRHLFDYVADERHLYAQVQNACDMFNVIVDVDAYFEDENEKPITLVQVFDEEAKRKGGQDSIAIVSDHPESILRCGPAQPVRPELWCEADGVLMAQLWEVYGNLLRSRWLKSPCRVSPSAQDEFHALLPVSEDCMAVILPFRQLYSKHNADDLFNRCCRIHNRHCPSAHPAFRWIENYRTQFNKLLEQPARIPFIQTDLSAKRYLDAFAYGARIVHATSNSNDPAADLNGLLSAHAREIAVMGYHYILHTLVRCIGMAMPIIRQNVVHWINDLGWRGNTSTGGSVLFGG